MSAWPVTTTDSYVPVARATVDGTLRTLATELKLACDTEERNGELDGSRQSSRD